MLIYKLSLLIILLLPLIGSIIGFIIGRKKERYRDCFNIILTGIEFIIVTLLFKSATTTGIQLFLPDVMGTGLHLRLDTFRYIFVWITAFLWFLSTIYSTQYLIKYKNRNRYYAFFMLTLFSTMGIFMSENMMNLFTFFEIMSFTSYVLVIHDEGEYAHEAGKIYLGMAIAGGLILLMGLFLLFDYTQTLTISDIPSQIRHLGGIKYLICSLIIIGFGVKASMFPLHVWVPKVYPAAPTPASGILSGVLLKTGLFGIIITSVVILEGDFIISTIILTSGLINMFIGGFLAIFQRNIKRILAYSGMSQAGYILVGIGLMGILKGHSIVPYFGVLYHIFNHAVFKVLLFFGAGIIYMILHELSINKIKGFGKHKTTLKIVFAVGALAMMGMPGFNGFISKTLLHEALAEAHLLYHSHWFTLAEIIFTLGSSFTVVYLLKIFITVFTEENEQFRGQYKNQIKIRALLPMTVLGILIIYIGLRPDTILNILEKATLSLGVKGHLENTFYTFYNIKSSLFTIILGTIIYLVLVKRYLRKTVNGDVVYVNPSINWFNLEKNVYEPVIAVTFKISSKLFSIIDQSVLGTVKFLSDTLKVISEKEVKFFTRIFSSIPLCKKINIKLMEHDNSKYTRDNIGKISDITVNIRSKLNSIVYSVFIVAAMLVIVLSILILR